jgi:ribosomal protein S18 acetylase RimI-like enzyme
MSIAQRPAPGGWRWCAGEAGSRIAALHNGGVNEPQVRIRPVNDGDRPMLAWLVAELWGSDVVAVHGCVLRPAELPGFIAERSRRIVGLLTYRLLGDILEIVTLNAIQRRIGIGTLLIEASVGSARRSGCRQIRLTTTNDNIDALRFYQRRGFRLAELRPGAVDRARQRKTEIPRVGDYGIPLRDEIDLTLRV